MATTEAAAAGLKVTREEIEEINAKSVIRQVNLSDLSVDRTYQRDPSQSLVDKISEEWDEVASELLLVSDRGANRKDRWPEGGQYYLVNGQHRSLAAAKRGIKKVQARVIDLTEVPDPAAFEAIFRLRTNVRLGDKPVERFKAQVRSGDPDSLAIVIMLENFGTYVNETVGDTGINAVTALEKLYRVDDGKLLQETLQLIKDAYGGLGGMYTTQPILVGVAWFILKHQDESDRTRVVQQLAHSGPAALDRRARAIAASMPGTLWQNYYRAVVEFYNERLSDSKKLEWRTRGASTFKGGAGDRWGKA